MTTTEPWPNIRPRSQRTAVDRPASLAEALGSEQRLTDLVAVLEFAFCPSCREEIATGRRKTAEAPLPQVCQPCQDKQARESFRQVPVISGAPQGEEYLSRRDEARIAPALRWAGVPPVLVLSGEVRSGKSTLAGHVARQLRRSGLWVRASRAAATKPADREPLYDAPLLVIDDLGHAHGSPWEWEAIESIISDRWDQRLPTIITTRLSLAAIAAQDPSTGDRLLGAVWVDLAHAGLPAKVRERGYR